MGLPLRFNRLELAGSLGDLGTLLPLAMGMILINGLSPGGIFFSVGIFYILSGLYFGVTTSVQPMKVIGAYAVASALSAQQIWAATLIMAVLLFIIGASGLIALISKNTPKSTVRGVQLATGILLMIQGIKCMLGTSTIQQLHHMAEPYLAWQQIFSIPIGIPIGILGVFLTLLLIDNRKIPAGLVVIGFGLLVGIGLGDHRDLAAFGFQLALPQLVAFGMPDRVDFTFAFFALVLPQVPMTIGNAVLANADLSREYFGEASRKVTGPALCISMALANLLAVMFGGMPVCHGAGGLAAHYRFGARSAGSNLMIGVFMVVAVLLVGDQLPSVFNLIPVAVLGVLLFFAGGQLALTIMDLQSKTDIFVTLVILATTLATNLAVGFMVGLVLAIMMRWPKLNP